MHQGLVELPDAAQMNIHAKFMKKLPAKIRQRAEVLLAYHEEHEGRQEAYQKEEAELREQFEKDVAHLLARRKEIVNGTGAPISEEEVKKGVPSEFEGQISTEADPEEEAVTGLPDFWLRALHHNYLLSTIIEEYDEDVLKHLTDISVRTIEWATGSTAIDFHFSPNNFFSNEVLTIEVLNQEDNQGVKGTTINWKLGHDVTVEVVKQKQKARTTGKVREITKEKPRASFFNLFKGADAEDDEDEDDDEEEDGRFSMGHIAEIARVIASNVVPIAVLNYTGEAPDGTDDMEDDDEEYEEDDDDDDFDAAEMMAQLQALGRGRGRRGGRGF